jgi:hypothetical protein
VPVTVRRLDPIAARALGAGAGAALLVRHDGVLVAVLPAARAASWGRSPMSVA